VTIELYFLRHAHAGDAATWTAPDASRPLSEKGERQAEKMGRHLAEIGFKPDAIITSPKVRAARTAEIVAGHLDVEVMADPRLAGPLTLEDLGDVLTDAGNPVRPVLCGHDPDFSDLVTELVGATIEVKKGALVRIDLDGAIEPDVGELRWLLPPSLLPDR
jgi:phosphohistidine phosphatase